MVHQIYFFIQPGNHALIKGWATVSAVMSEIGMASGHLVGQSMLVSR